MTRIEVHPDSQDQGIGTAVMRQVLLEAGEAGKAVSLHVITINPGRRLYRRLGFKIVNESETRILMKATRGLGRDRPRGD